jgi:glycosyl transferase family 25
VVKLDMAGGRIGVAKSACDAPGGRKLCLLRTAHTGGAGYIVSRTYAAKLIEESATLKEAVDDFLFGLDAVAKDDGQIWQMVPAAVAQEKHLNTDLQPELQSLIQPKRHKKPWLKQLGRNLEKPVRIVIRAVRRQYRSATQDIRYLQMTFR